MDNSEDGENETEVEVNSGIAGEIITIGDQYLDSPPEMQIVIPSRAKATAFYDLVAYVFLKAKKKSATLPSPSSSALCHLRLSINYQEMVLLPGIINTVSPNARKFSLSKKIMAESRLPELDPHSETHKTVKSLLAELLKVLYPDFDKDRCCEPDFVQLQKKVWQLLQDDGAPDPILT
ncbi:hypothetical protein BG003_007511 [Podila horticola]|nr:hypothetical protein BG003_007511 [Podila horticola]